MDLVPNVTIIPMWFIFIASVFILNTLVFKPTLRILSKRKQMTVGLKKDVGYFQDQTSIKLKEYESLMGETRKMAQAAREKVVKAADAEQREILEAAKAEAERYLDGVKTTIKRESEDALKTLREDSKNLAQEIVDKLFDRRAA